MDTWVIERFSYDLEMKMRQQNRNNNGTEIERYDWFIKGIQTPENFLEINRYFALTPYCNTIGQSNNAFSILGTVQQLPGRGGGECVKYAPKLSHPPLSLSKS